METVKKDNNVSYLPNMHLKLGIKVWGQMFKELRSSKELIMRFFIRDISAKYRQSFLGYIWVFIIPFIAIGSFMFLNRAGILNIGVTDVPYPLFALIGLAVWQLFATGIVTGANSLVNAGGMIVKINFPREALVFSSIAQAIFEFLIKIGLIIVFFLVFKFIPYWTSIFFVFSVIPLLFLALGLSFILSLVSGVFRDAANVVSLVMNFLLFLTPVLYPLTAQNIFFKLNPLTALVNAPRDLIIYGYIKDPVDFFIASLLSILIFFVFWRIFHLVETKIPERV